jgi:murein DD-endopeptidase MepM/ murein hydrolase activator NlpD
LRDELTFKKTEDDYYGKKLCLPTNKVSVGILRQGTVNVKKHALNFIGLILQLVILCTWVWYKHAMNTSVPVTSPVAIPSSQTAETQPKNSPASNKQQTTEQQQPDPIAITEAPWQQTAILKGDSLRHIFTREKLPLTQLQQIQKTTQAKLLNQLPVGGNVLYQLDDSRQLAQMLVLFNDQKLVRIQASAPKKFQISAEVPKFDTQLIYASSMIKDSLSVSARQAGLSNHVITQITEILGSTIDFAVDLKKNDTFHILFEEKQLNGKKIGKEKILAVEFNNRGKVYQAIRYQSQKGHANYFSPEGNGLQKAYLRTPIESARISSHFGNRRHPVLHRIRAHKGVDYAAPTGTPIKAVSDAKVVFVGTKGGYGKSVELRHSKTHSTFYAHMSKFSSNIQNGSIVSKGQVIGYVGKTGLASGPHLHYEFRINGVHHNPLTVALPRTQTISGTHKKNFTEHAHKLMALLNSHKTISVAKNGAYSQVSPRLAATVIQ